MSDSSSGSSGTSWSKPSAPQPGLWAGGSSPSRPNPPAIAPPKAPSLPKMPKLPTWAKLPKLPKPKSGWKPSKGSLPGYKPGHTPHHGYGGHLPVIGGIPVFGGGHSHDHDHHPASSTLSCIHAKGLDRLRCEKADAVVGLLFAIIGFLLAPFLIYMFVRYCKRKWSRRKNNRHEEDGMELRHGMNGCDPGAQISRGVLEAESNIGLAISTSEGSSTLVKEHTQDHSPGSSQQRKSTSPYQPRTGSDSYERRPSQDTHSIGSATSSLSASLVRIATLGMAMGDPQVVDIPPSLANSRRNSMRTRRSASILDMIPDCNPSHDGGWPLSEGVGNCGVDNTAEGGSRLKEMERRSESSSHGSDDGCCPDDAASTCSSTRSSDHGCSNQPGDEVDAPDDTASKHSDSGSSAPLGCNEEGLYYTSSSENPVDAGMEAQEDYR